MNLNHLAPMLEVDDMDETIRYYESILGFDCTNRLEQDWAIVQKEKVILMFAARREKERHPRPYLTGSIYLYTDHTDEWWRVLKEKAEVAYPIETFSYGMREFAIRDCNGYLLQFGESIAAQASDV